MSRAELIRAMGAAGLFVEANGNRVHGLSDTGHVYARPAGSAWKLRSSRASKVGRIVRTEEEVAVACAVLAGER